MIKFKVDYLENCKKYIPSVSEAVKEYLNLEADKGKGFVLPAQTLNPFLKALEAMQQKGVIIIPLSYNAVDKYILCQKVIVTEKSQGFIDSTKLPANEILYLVVKTSLVNYRVGQIELEAMV